MNNDNFDDIIKQKADGHQATVPSDAWGNIKKKKKKKPFPFFWWSLSSLVIVGVVSTAILLNGNRDKLLSTTDKEKINTSTEKNINSDKEVGSKKNSFFETTRNGTEHLISKEAVDKNIDHTENLLSQNNTSTLLVSNTNKLKKLQYAHKTKVRVKQPGISDETIKKQKYPLNNDLTISTNKETNTNDITTLPNDPTVSNDLTIKKNEEKLNTALFTTIKEKDSSTNKKNDNTLKKKKWSAFIIDLSTTIFSPIQSYDNVQFFTRINNVDNVHSLYKTSSFKSTLQTQIAFGINIRKNINKKLTIGTGIQYAQIKEKLSFSGIQTDTTFTIVQRLAYNNNIAYLKNDTIATTTTGHRTIDALNSYKLYSIPLYFNYTFADRPKFSYSFTGGAYFTFAQYHNAIQGNLQSLTAIGIQPVNEKNKMTIDIFGGVHLSWLFNKYFRLYTEPIFRYNITKYKLKNTLTNKNISQAGVSVGVSYEIK